MFITGTMMLNIGAFPFALIKAIILNIELKAKRIAHIGCFIPHPSLRPIHYNNPDVLPADILSNTSLVHPRIHLLPDQDDGLCKLARWDSLGTYSYF